MPRSIASGHRAALFSAAHAENPNPTTQFLTGRPTGGRRDDPCSAKSGLTSGRRASRKPGVRHLDEATMGAGFHATIPNARLRPTVLHPWSTRRRRRRRTAASITGRPPRRSMLLRVADRLRRKRPTNGRRMAIDSAPVDVCVTHAESSQPNLRPGWHALVVINATSGMTVAWSVAPATGQTRRRTQPAVARRRRRRRGRRAR